MNEIKKENLNLLPEKAESKELLEKEKILRLAEAWSEEELSQHFRQPAEEIGEFDPEKELAEISARGGSASGGKNQVRRAPIHEQRRLKRELMAEFKKKFIDQRQGLAELVVKLEDYVRSNPDAPKDDLLKLISEKTPVYQLNQKQIERFQKAIDIYCQKHQTIQKYVRHYQERFKENWQKEFFKDLYGTYPVGEIDFEVGPTTLCWIYIHPKDGALILGTSKETAAHLHGGKGYKKVNLEGLEDTIIALNFLRFIKTGFIQSGPDTKVNETRKHEEFHAIHDLFLFDLLSELQKTIEYLKEGHFRKDIKEDEIFKLIEKFIFPTVRKARKLFEGLIKSEILARLKAGGREAKEVLSFGLVEERLLDYSSYQFFEKRLFAKEGKWLSLAKILVVELIDNFGQDYEKFVLKIIKMAINAEKEIYEGSMIDGLAALRELAKIHPYDCDRNKLVALLSIEPLAKWPRLAKMFKEVEETSKS